MTPWRLGLARVLALLGLPRPDGATPRLPKAAERGNARGLLNVGLLHPRGLGLPRYVTEAAEQGRVDAHAAPSAHDHLVETVRWYHMAAEQGRVDAQAMLAVAYQVGDGVAKDYVEAARWYRKAAEQGHARCQFRLGSAYRKGVGVAKDPVEAVRWYLMAAEQGMPEAEWALGDAYAKGEGVTQDGEAAADWYYRAGLGWAAQGERDKALLCVERIRELKAASSARLVVALAAVIPESPSKPTKPN